MKIDFLVADNLYQSTVHFATKFCDALEKQGVKTRKFWISDDCFYQAFYEISADPPDLTCSFSNISMNGISLGELWQIPHLSLLIDPAIYFLHQIRGKHSWVSCVDQDDCSFIKSLGFSNVFFLPHGVEKQLLTPVDKERCYEAVFFGSCCEHSLTSELTEAASERVLSSEGISILRALMELGVSEEELPKLHYEVDLYTRFKDRIEILKKLGSSLHIWGNGPWKKYCPEAAIHEPIEFQNTFSIMQQAKVVVNSSPRFKSGSHERILFALMCGACPLTAENRFIKENFEEMLTYKHGEWEIGSFAKWKEIAEKGQQLVLKSHTWDNRAKTLIDRLV